MARLIMWNLMTLDGFVEGPNRDISWHSDVWGEELEQLSIEQLNAAGGLLFGRVTYELMANHWPSATGEVADFMNAAPKHVFSRTLTASGWNNTRLHGDDAPATVARLKRETAKDIFLFGSADLAASLIPHGLIDELDLLHLRGDRHYYETHGPRDHIHVACLRCGKVREFESRLYEQLKEQIARDFNMKVTVSRTEVPSYTSALETLPTKKYKVAYIRETVESDSIQPEIREAIRSKIEKLKADGHVVESIEFPLIEYILPTYYILATAEASSNLSRFDGVRYGYRSKDTQDLDSLYKKTRSEAFGKEVQRRILLGTFVLSAGYFDAYFTQAQKVRKQLFDKTQLIFNDFDIILLPTVPAPAFRVGEKTDDPIAMYLADIYTVYANLTGIPAISIPLFTHSSGMPFGLQAMANQLSELSLLSFAHQLATV